MPTQHQVLQFYLINLKKRYYQNLKNYPKLKQHHNSRRVENTFKACEFRAKYLLTFFIKQWKNNVLQPAHQLQNEAKCIYDQNVLHKAVRSLLTTKSKIDDLNNIANNALFCIQNAKKQAILAKFTQIAREKIRGKQITKFQQKRNFAVLQNTFKTAIQFFNYRVLCYEKCDEIRQNIDLKLLQTSFISLLNHYQAAKNDKLRVLEALDFYEKNAKINYTENILKAALKISQGQLQERAESVAFQAKNKFLTEERNRRNEKLNSMRISQNQKVDDSVFQDFPSQHSRRSALTINSLQYQPFQVQVNLQQSLQDQFVQSQINDLKILQNTVIDDKNRLQKEIEKLHILQCRLDKTMHPWSAQIEADAQKLIVSELKIQIQDNDEMVESIKERLRQYK
ncbi:hypothetical protein SS50377_27019 [Spironucleus salmonicida]|uniref:Uncharacterized protein n=1 Tax=Spironucleus salmonicida TaxID=348837 RepID=V6LSF1_9EUKA|nr:hypothetical protein SS50377_27019 [Spironucleus salmonicida]|eukprot:EST47530.1 Hypothetical protein SS50377_12514 [Spironucleus salmonicida]